MKVSKQITAENTFSDLINVPENQQNSNFGYLLLIIDGQSDSTLTLQCSDDGGTTWYDVKTFSADTVEEVFLPAMNAAARIGVKTGDYGTDTVNVKLLK